MGKPGRHKEYGYRMEIRRRWAQEITLFLNEDSLDLQMNTEHGKCLRNVFIHAGRNFSFQGECRTTQYDTIDEEDVLDTDTVVEHITEEPKEGEEGEPKKKAKIVRRPVSISDIHPLWGKKSKRMHERRVYWILSKGIHGL